MQQISAVKNLLYQSNFLWLCKSVYTIIYWIVETITIDINWWVNSEDSFFLYIKLSFIKSWDQNTP